MLPDDVPGTSWAESLQADTDDASFRDKALTVAVCGAVALLIVAAGVVVGVMG